MPEDLWHPPSTVHPSQLHTPHPPGYTYRDPIPTFITQTPGKLLDDYYIDRSIPEWTDPKDLARGKWEAWLNHPCNAIGSPGSVARPRDLAVVPVPGSPWVTFMYGMRNALEGAGDIVLQGSKRVNMRLLISWPGYQAQFCMIHTAAAHGGHPSRFELGYKIAKAYADYFENVKEQCLPPSEVGFYNISLDQDSESRSDSSGVQLHQLHLVKLHGMIGGTWVAEVDVV
ncbi:hypothetical protein J3R82DRAFT_11211 [Butyriboletus roseoflavus]|nr:hypothetical protein J3R82DRAFT_11211 [Butyriboletus roseoflavus]